MVARHAEPAEGDQGERADGEQSQRHDQGLARESAAGPKPAEQRKQNHAEHRGMGAVAEGQWTAQQSEPELHEPAQPGRREIARGVSRVERETVEEDSDRGGGETTPKAEHAPAALMD